MHHQQIGTQSRGVHSTSVSTEPFLPQPVSVRPKRTIRKPVRYRNSTYVSEDIVSSSYLSSRYKIKRIVDQKQIDNDIQYKVTLICVVNLHTNHFVFFAKILMEKL